MYKKIQIFTDGSCSGNPGPGGIGIILCYKKYKKEISIGYYFTTNNRMELMAIIIAIETLKNPCEIILNTDSMYVLKGLTQWMHHWKKNNWKSKKNKNIKNIDLWSRLNLIIKSHILYCQWLKGHSGHIENERCNLLAKLASLNPSKEDIFPNKNNTNNYN